MSTDTFPLAYRSGDISPFACNEALVSSDHGVPHRIQLPDGLAQGMRAHSRVDIRMKGDLNAENYHGAVLEAAPDARISTANRYEALISVSAIIKKHHDIEALFTALATELLRVVDFDFIGIAQYDERSHRFDRHLSRTYGVVDRGVIDGTKDEMMSEWVYQHQEPLALPYLDRNSQLRWKVKELANDGIQSLCAFPLTCVHQRIGSFLIGSKQVNAYSTDEIEFISGIADMVASAVNDVTNFAQLQTAKTELEMETKRLQLLLELNNRIISNLELRDLLRSVSCSVRRVMQCDAVAIHLPSSEDSQLQLYVVDRLVALGSHTEDQLESLDGCKHRYPAEVFRSAKPTVFDTAQPGDVCNSQHCIYRGPGAGDLVPLVCALPLISRGQVLGVLELIRHQQPAFGHSDAAFMAHLANQIAIAIENVSAFREISELKNQLAREKIYLEDEIRSEHGFEEIIGRSSAIRTVFHKIETVAPTDSTVLICGETGTGKELIARAIHERSARHGGPFVKLNCAAIPTGLLESELFGHERGAFTGAIMQRIGRFELANRGTAFLDEIGEIALELQPKLLRVLQEREFERLGSSRTINTDARLIAATNRDLTACVSDQTFRADLYYRLNVFPIHVPPLRERPEDIPLLVRYFVQHYARRMNRSIDTIPSDAMEALVRYSWPGNIRELQNLIEHSVILSSGATLRVPLANLNSEIAPKQGAGKRMTLQDAEREHILATLKETKWIISGARGAAARLGMNRSTLQFRMKKLGILRPGSD